MDERKRKILLAVIQDYISTAEPVGSRTISKNYKLGVSPATIRNEMSDLEELGYIEQPHTSAGRIPSELGYRYYVDYLMEKQPLDDNVRTAINSEFDRRKHEVAAVIKSTSELLSGMTNYTAIVMAPTVTNNVCKHIQLVPVDIGKALVVVVTEGGFVQNQLIDVPENIGYQELNQISQVINARLGGKTVDAIQRTLISEIYFELAKGKEIAELAMELLSHSGTISDDQQRLYLAGTLNILNQPEFKSIEKVKTLLSLLDQEELLKQLLTEQQLGDGINVKIGAEAQLPGVKDCSIITATYHVDGSVIGSIGVLGPTRMEYDKVVALVEYINGQLSKVLSTHFDRKGRHK